jgi:phenylacetate-CoA ligase
LFKKAKFKPEYLRDIRDIGNIPVTTKQDVRDNFFDMMPVGTDLSRCIETSTTGSTGVPFKHYKGVREVVKDTAAKWYAFSECGTKLTDKFVNITRVTMSMMLPTQIHISYRHNLEYTVEHLRKIEPDILYAAPSKLEDISFHDVSGISPRLIFSQAEILTERHRGLFRSVFGLEVFDTYGSREFSRLAFECEEHYGQHMITDSAVMEFLDEDGEDVASGESGEIIVTGLHNYVMPLVRYNLEDVAVPIDERCGCGRSWPLIKQIIGRTSELFTMPTGRELDPWLLNAVISKEVWKNIFVISQYQMIQESRSKILVKIVKGRDFDPDIVLKIKRGIEDVCYNMNEDVDVEINIVDVIPKDRSGKRQMFVSMMKNR